MRKKSESETVNNTLTQQTKLINELKEENYRLKNMLKKIPGSVYYKDDKGAYLNCNDFVLKMANLKSYSEIINKTDFDMPWREYADEIHRTDQKVIDSEEPLELEEYPLVNGKRIPMLTRKTPDFDKNGKAIGIIGVSLDITELKKTQSKLEIALKKAEVANQAKTEFIENMRHDIRTPLSGMVGSAHLIQIHSNNPKKVEEYATDLIQSSDALFEFLNKILASLKVATGEIPLLKKIFDLHKELERIIRLNKPQAKVKHLNFHFDYDKTIPSYLLGDPVRIQAIALELVTNALKYTSKGEIKVSAHLMKNEKREVIVELRVSDIGIGIPRDKHQEVYTRFTRLTPSYQGIYPGTGLGLSVVKQYIDDLNGEIRIDSDVGKGTTFICLIPLQESLSTADDSKSDETPSFANDIHHVVTEKPAEMLELQAMPVTTGSHILVVEDNPMAAKVAKGALLALNCQVDIAPDGKTALTLIEKNHYRLILMDIGLPDGDGCDVTRRIRLKQWQSNPTVPIIGLTAHVEEALPCKWNECDVHQTLNS